MKKRITSILMAIVMAFILLPTVAFADRAPDYISECGTTGIEEGTKHYLAEENLSGNGWDWDAKTGTLTLNNFTGYAINFGTYYGKKIVLAEGSVNTIWYLWLKPNSNGIVIEGSGQLSIKSIFNIHTYDGSVAIADSLPLMGRSKYNSPLEPLTIAYKNSWGEAVTADGVCATYIQIGPADSSNPGAVSPPTFTDVPQWCSAAVDWALEKKITIGTGENKFSPDTQCKNSEILTFLWCAAGEPYPGTDAPIPLNGDEWYAEAVRWAARKHMISEGFDPNALCTRASALNFIFQGVSPNEVNIPQRNSFVDVPRNAYYGVAVDWAVTYGITNGTSATTFGPNDTCTRGQIVTFLHRAYVPGARLTAS